MPRIQRRAGSSTIFHISHAMTNEPAIASTTPTAYSTPDSMPMAFMPARHVPNQTRCVIYSEYEINPPSTMVLVDSHFTCPRLDNARAPIHTISGGTSHRWKNGGSGSASGSVMRISGCAATQRPRNTARR